MKTVITIFALVAATYALDITKVTGTTPPAVPCPNSLCKGKADGNFEYKYYGEYRANYFLQCSNGLAYCQPCFPLHLQFSEGCNQCLYTKHDDCVTTKSWKPATTFKCPDKCPDRGPHFSGNIGDSHNDQHYVACWKGQTVGCVACPSHLSFNEEWNACLYEGKYVTERFNPYNPKYI